MMANVYRHHTKVFCLFGRNYFEPCEIIDPIVLLIEASHKDLSTERQMGVSGSGKSRRVNA